MRETEREREREREREGLGERREGWQGWALPLVGFEREGEKEMVARPIRPNFD
jgi:hypothetical protein